MVVVKYLGIGTDTRVSGFETNHGQFLYSPYTPCLPTVKTKLLKMQLRFAHFLTAPLSPHKLILNVNVFSVIFLIQFLLLSLIFGIPLLAMFASLGQYLGSGLIDMWRISPIFLVRELQFFASIF